MAFQICIGRLIPGDDFVAEIVEHEITLIGHYRENRMTDKVGCKNYGDAKRTLRNAQFDQGFALGQDIILAVAEPVLGDRPVFLRTIMFLSSTETNVRLTMRLTSCNSRQTISVNAICAGPSAGLQTDTLRWQNATYPEGGLVSAPNRP